MDVKEVLLPSIGVRYEFTSHDGERIGIIARRSGDFEVVRYARDDPDQAQPIFHFTDEEADAVAQILGAPRIAERFTELTREVPGLEAGQVHIRPGSPFAERPLGETRARTRTGASIVAIVRNERCWHRRVRPRCCMPTTYWWWSAPKTASPRSSSSSIRAERVQISAPLLLQLGAVLTVLAHCWARSLAGSRSPRYRCICWPVWHSATAASRRWQPPVSSSPPGAPIGIVLLLLTLGLEFSATEFASSLRHHLPSAAVDVVLNATPGALAGWLLGLNGVGILALAGVTYVSSSGVIARLLEDLHRLGNRETPAVLAVLVLEDFAMAAYLPLVAVLGAGGSWLVAIGGMAAAVAALCMAFAASYRWGHHVGRLVTHPDSEQLLLRVLGITLIVAALAEHDARVGGGGRLPGRPDPHR